MSYTITLRLNEPQKAMKQLRFYLFFWWHRIGLGVHQNALFDRVGRPGVTPLLFWCNVVEQVTPAFAALAARLPDVP